MSLIDRIHQAQVLAGEKAVIADLHRQMGIVDAHPTDKLAGIVAKMRADLTELGGFENSLVSIPAGGVAAYILKIEAAIAELRRTP